MRAVIDIGTNTFHLLIAEVIDQNQINIIYKNTIAVKLGEGGVNKGFIAPQAYARGINALIEFRKQIDSLQITNILATATAAVRDASNGQDFIKEAYQKSQISITLIDGLKEAEYIYTGAKGAHVLSNTADLIMDIGGGSVEFIICNRDQIFWKNSYQLGAARLLADFYVNEAALKTDEITNIHNLFQQKLTDLFDAIKTFKPIKLIGTAGSFDSFATMVTIDKKDVYNANIHQSFSFNKTEFMELLDTIIKSNNQERKAMKGLIPLRIDMILMAAILSKFVVKQFKIKEIVTCSYSLKEGLILSS
jgi:exopolyphosphatase/guanosine-5'-triphosphate,3'-diphosphate pyrophosphatase